MRPFSAFTHDRLIAEGELRDVAIVCKQFVDANPESTVLVFENESAGITEIDFRGDESTVLAWVDAQYPDLVKPPSRGRGRPKLGVVSREVTLLPRHWDWLSAQPGGASVTLRKLVDGARKDDENSARHAQDLTYGFSVKIAGDLPGFEEATPDLIEAILGEAARMCEEIPFWTLYAEPTCLFESCQSQQE